MANLRTNNLSGEQGQNAYRGAVNFGGYVDGNSSDFLSVADHDDFDMGTGDFTFECWLVAVSHAGTTSPAYMDFCASRTYGAGGILIQIANDGEFRLIFPTGGSYTILKGGSSMFNTSGMTDWMHVAVVRSSGTVKGYLNGLEQVSGSVGLSVDFSLGGFCDIGDGYGSDDNDYPFRGVISNLRILKGRALYTSEFTPPTSELTIIKDTILLCCQDSDNPYQEATGKTITGSGNHASVGYNKTQPKVIPPYGVDAGNTFGGPIQQSSQGYMYFPTGRTEERGRGRGLFGGGVTPSGTSRISFVNIQSQGDSIKFGALTRASTLLASCSSQTRGLWGGNYPSATNVIDFVTIATRGDAQDYGDLTVARWNFAALSNETRGVFCGGHSPTQHNTMDFITMATLGDASDFGDLLSKFSGVSSCASPTRGLIFGGTDPSGSPISGKTNIIEFITIATAGNAQDFGDLTEVKHNSSGLSSQTRGINAGGNPGSMSDVIAFVEISTTGNAIDFGNLITGRQGPATVSNSIRGLFASGVTPSNTNLIDFITIATTGNASDFGDIDSVQTHFPEGCSDSHGGLS